MHNVSIGIHKLFEVLVVIGGRTQEFELRVVFFTFTQCDEEVLAIYGHELSGVLDHGLVDLGHFFRGLG